MEEGKVPRCMVGSQDALLFIPIGMQMNQTIPVTMKIVFMLLVENGMTTLLKLLSTAAVSTIQL
jgi:putative effector of murein hydrolase LrgA (UPF0299 family)